MNLLGAGRAPFLAASLACIARLQLPARALLHPATCLPAQPPDASCLCFRLPACQPQKLTISLLPFSTFSPQQVKDWISAWQTGGEGKAAETLEFPARDAAPTTRVTEPSLPSSASAVLNAMTADAPVGATPVGEDGPAAGSGSQAPGVEEKELSAVAAVAAAPAEPAEPAGDTGAAEKEAEYKARISAGRPRLKAF